MPVDEIIATYIECTRWANDACKCTTGERSSYGKSASLNFCGSQLSIPINQADSYPGEGSTLHRSIEGYNSTVHNVRGLGQVSRLTKVSKFQSCRFTVVCYSHVGLQHTSNWTASISYPLSKAKRFQSFMSSFSPLFTSVNSSIICTHIRIIAYT